MFAVAKLLYWLYRLSRRNCAWMSQMRGIYEFRHIFLQYVSRVPSWASWVGHVIDVWLIAALESILKTTLYGIGVRSLLVRSLFLECPKWSDISGQVIWCRGPVGAVRKLHTVANRIWQFFDVNAVAWISVYTWLNLKTSGRRTSAYRFGAILNRCLSVCISISVSAMTSSVAYVSGRWLTSFFHEDYVPSGLLENFSFCSYRRDARETAVNLAMKCFKHQMVAPPQIPFELHVSLYVARNLRNEIGLLGSNLFVLFRTWRLFWYLPRFFTIPSA